MNQPIKMRKEISEFIVEFVLENGEILIRGSQRRQNSDNEQRQEKWAELACQVNKAFGLNLDAEKVKQHFNNRRKSVMNRVKEEMRHPHPQFESAAAALSWLRSRRALLVESDAAIASFFLPTEDEINNETTSSVPSDDVAAFLNGIGANVGGGLEMDEETSCHIIDTPQTYESIPINTSLLHKPAPICSSHVVVDVSGRSELKRLLNILIDHGFCQFHHVDFPSHSTASSITSKSRKRRNLASRETPPLSRGSAPFSGLFQMNDLRAPSESVCSTENIDGEGRAMDVEERGGEEGNFNANGSTSDVNGGMRIKEEVTEEADNENGHLLELISSLTSRGGVASSNSRKGEKEYTAEGHSILCASCDSVVRINSSGSKWNLFEHVVVKHSKHRPYKCPLCSYVAVRKVRVRQHLLSLHDMDGEAVDVVTQSMREEWERTMSECFPNHSAPKVIRD